MPFGNSHLHLLQESLIAWQNEVWIQAGLRVLRRHPAWIRRHQKSDNLELGILLRPYSQLFQQKVP